MILFYIDARNNICQEKNKTDHDRSVSQYRQSVTIPAVMSLIILL